MAKITALAPQKLRAPLAVTSIKHITSDSIEAVSRQPSPQQRALEALDLALHINAKGYNVYLAGEPDLGRSFLLKDYLAPRAAERPTPPDLVYVFNFDDHDAPRLLSLPAGQGRKLKAELGKLFQTILKEIPLRLNREGFTKKRSLIFDKYQSKRDNLLKQMDQLACSNGFSLAVDEAGGMSLYPVVDGKKLNEQELESLNSKEKEQLKSRSHDLVKPMSNYMRDLAEAEEKFLSQERSLERNLLDDFLKETLDSLAAEYTQTPESQELETFFTQLRDDILEHLDIFISQQTTQSLEPSMMQPAVHDLTPTDMLSGRFNVNLFVDNAELTGAPIIFLDHPTLANLMGCIEREAEMGTLITDFTLIKAGGIHKANGGYLVLHMDDILHYNTAWEALLRALRSGLSRIEDAGEEETNKTKGIQPDPVPLSLKVILVGKEEIYELLLNVDERFNKLFKIKAHMTEHMPRNSRSIQTYLTQLKRIIVDDSLLPFDKLALAKLVDYGSWLIEDQKKLSLKFPLIREIMIEASAFAEIAKQDVVTEKIFDRAIQARNFRSNLVEEAFMEEYDRKIIKVVTDGQAIGKANGLAVSMYGDFEFGLPHQISCTIGAGQGGITDLERDAQLGGPIHTKAMMILKSYLVGAFAHDKPLVLSGSLGFEQNYVGIEGDSASGAELAALLSALSGVPINLAFAFTGAVSQSGDIMAVGGVTCKIEGYFEVCKRHGLTGRQSVILPHDNISHLMLNDEVINAVEKKQFHIYPVRHITEAMQLLTGIPSGSLRKDGTYTPGSLYDKVNKRVKELAAIGLPKKGSRY